MFDADVIKLMSMDQRQFFDISIIDVDLDVDIDKLKVMLMSMKR